MGEFIGVIGRVLLILFVVRLVVSLFSGGRTRRTGAPRTGAPGTGRTGSTGSTTGTRLVRDPQCGTYVSELSAVRVLHGGAMVYFCSEKCRDAYLAAPRANAS